MIRKPVLFGPAFFWPDSFHSADWIKHLAQAEINRQSFSYWYREGNRVLHIVHVCAEPRRSSESRRKWRF